MLGLLGAWVRDVQLGGEGTVVTVVLRRRRAVCAGCGARRGLQIHDRRVKRWRHLDLGGCRCVIECELRRVRCAGCRRLGLEAVAWARADAPYTRDFEDLAAWLAQQMNKTQITRLLRIGWASVGEIVARVVAEQLDGGRLDGLEMLGDRASAPMTSPPNREENRSWRAPPPDSPVSCGCTTPTGRSRGLRRTATPVPS